MSVATVNYAWMCSNPYPGRGIVIGATADGKHFVQIYWLMGRSENSRNRRLCANADGRLSTEPIDPTKVHGADLILYNAMLEGGGFYAVSNGAQTGSLIDAHAMNHRVLSDWSYEPDAPNYTPRVSGFVSVSGRHKHAAGLSILRRSVLDGSCERMFYFYERLQPGFGYGVTTYASDGNPIPSFIGEPILFAIGSGIATVAETYWQMLNQDNRVALGVKFINRTTKESDLFVINQY